MIPVALALRDDDGGELRGRLGGESPRRRPSLRRPRPSSPSRSRQRQSRRRRRRRPSRPGADGDAGAAVWSAGRRHPAARVRRHLHRRLQRLLEPLPRFIGRQRRGVAGRQRGQPLTRRCTSATSSASRRARRHRRPRRRRPRRPRRPPHRRRRRHRHPPATDSAASRTAAGTCRHDAARHDAAADGTGAAAECRRGRGADPGDLARRPRGAGADRSPSAKAVCARGSTTGAATACSPSTSRWARPGSPTLGVTSAAPALDARTNIAAAYHLYTRSGWSPVAHDRPGRLTTHDGPPSGFRSPGPLP